MIQLAENLYVGQPNNDFTRAYIVNKQGLILQDDWKIGYKIAEDRGFFVKEDPRGWNLTPLGKAMLKLTQ